MALRILLYMALGYAILVVLAFLIQRRLLYYPDQETLTESRAGAMGLQHWPGSGNQLKGFVNIQETGHSKGVVVVFHGNAGTAWHRVYYAEALGRLGYRVLLAEYPAYGGRKGKPGEKTFVRDAKETVQEAYSEFGGPLYLWGESLGCGVVAGVAADTAIPIKGIALITPWDSLPSLAQNLYWFLPVRWLMLDRYNNIKNLKSYSGPVAVLVAGQDEIIPKKLELKLYESLSRPKKLWIFENAGHNDWPVDPLEQWWREVTEFLSAHS